MRRAVPIVLCLLVVAAAPASPPAQSKRSAALTAALASTPAGGRLTAWVFFTDKGGAGRASAGQGASLLTPRARSRRALRGRVAALTSDDLPLSASYVDAVAAAVSRVRQRSRWLNAVSVEATPAQLQAIEALPFVARLDVVRRYRRREEEPLRAEEPPARSAVSGPRRRPHSPLALDYGSSLGQLAQLGVPDVHAMGLHGDGVVIAVFDSGFNSLNHEVFSSLRIVAAHDFVNGDDDVGDGSDLGEGSHGTETLSVLAGFQDGQLIGPAFASDVILAKTENTASETPVEEDNWAAAAEWAESLGADVISTSLGYLDYDSPFPSYGFADMDGRTAISTRAAEMAAARGVVVVASAGNSGFDAGHNTLGAPADGARVLAIGAVTSSGARASFSSVGPSTDGRIKPDFAAQGVNVKVALPGTVSRYGTASGTSFSCPLAAGVVALLLQLNPTASVDDVAGVLRATASQAGRPDNLLGWGIVDARAAALGWTPALPAAR